jgi:hypothetical protein
MGKWFDRIIGTSKPPIEVTWSRTNPAHTIAQGDSNEIKQIRQDKIILTVVSPNILDGEPVVKIGVTNFSKKALGFGADGVVLVVTSGGKTSAYASKCLKVGYPNIFDTHDLRDSDKPHRVVTVDTMKSEEHLRAVFDSIPAGELVEVVIQANRIFAAPYLFRIPFAFEHDGFGAASTPTQIRINELARELAVSVVVIIDYLPRTGITEKKYPSSVIDFAAAENVRQHFRKIAHTEGAAEEKNPTE